ncbi:hypothetical protein [Propionispira raffinosivorans]|nr:hypothetical protein [Propionispira raffinosivorans]
MEEDNLKMIEAIASIKIVATVKKGDTELAMDTDNLAALYA